MTDGERLIDGRGEVYYWYSFDDMSSSNQSIEEYFDELLDNHVKQHFHLPELMVVSLTKMADIKRAFMHNEYITPQNWYGKNPKGIELSYRGIYILGAPEVRSHEILFYPEYNEPNGVERAICRLNQKLSSKKAT